MKEARVNGLPLSSEEAVSVTLDHCRQRDPSVGAVGLTRVAGNYVDTRFVATFTPVDDLVVFAGPTGQTGRLH